MSIIGRFWVSTEDPTQQFVEQEDGTTLLRITVRGTRELANWVLSMAPHVKVVGPAGLREEVARRSRESAGLYER